MPLQNGEVLVIYSGGMDSFTLMEVAFQTFARVHALTFDYGQRHRAEIEAARAGWRFYATRHARRAGTHKVLDISGLGQVLGGSLLPQSVSGLGQVPEGHYANATMKKTVVPNRNSMLLNIAAAVAGAAGIPDVWFGAHGGDHDIYPDCRLEFVEVLNQSLWIGNYEDQRVTVGAPFLTEDKGKILRIGKGLGLISFDYARTWTCYKGPDEKYHACGRCGACVERLEAFNSIGWLDPLGYVDEAYWRTAK